jgi:hypothetical protein
MKRRMLPLLVAPSAVGIAIVMLSLWRAHVGEWQSFRLLTIPLSLLTITAWWGALSVATDIAKRRKGLVFPGIAQFYGLGIAIAGAPWPLLAISAVSVIVIVVFGHSGPVHNLPTSAEEARIAGTALLCLLSVSLPVLGYREKPTR